MTLNPRGPVKAALGTCSRCQVLGSHWRMTESETQEGEQYAEMFSPVFCASLDIRLNDRDWKQQGGGMDGLSRGEFL